MEKIDISILVRCYEYTSYTKSTIDSILNTATSDYNLIIQPNKASAAENSNILMDKATSEYIILMDDDLNFIQNGWDITLFEALFKYQSQGVGVVAPRLFDDKMCKVNPQSTVRNKGHAIGIKTSGALLAFKDVGIRYDENYIKTMYDDSDFLYQWIDNGYKVLVDGNVDVKHMKAATSTHTPWGKKNNAYFRKKWKMDDWANWGGLKYLS